MKNTSGKRLKMRVLLGKTPAPEVVSAQYAPEGKPYTEVAPGVIKPKQGSEVVWNDSTIDDVVELVPIVDEQKPEQLPELAPLEVNYTIKNDSGEDWEYIPADKIPELQVIDDGAEIRNKSGDVVGYRVQLKPGVRTDASGNTTGYVTQDGKEISWS